MEDDKLEDLEQQLDNVLEKLRGEEGEKLIQEEELDEKTIEKFIQKIEEKTDKSSLIQHLKDRRIKYEEPADLLYFQFKPVAEGEVKESVPVESTDLVLDINTDGEIVSMECLNASQNFPDEWINLIKLMQKYGK